MGIEVKQMVIQSKINTSAKPEPEKDASSPLPEGADPVREYRAQFLKMRGEIRER